MPNCIFGMHFCPKSQKSNEFAQKPMPKKMQFLNNRHSPVFKVFGRSLRFFSLLDLFLFGAVGGSRVRGRCGRGEDPGTWGALGVGLWSGFFG